MNPKPTIIALALMLFSISTLGQYRYIQKLGNLGTIALPDTPKLVEKENIKIFLTRYKGVVFLAGTGDVSGGLKYLFRKNSLDSLYDRYIEGSLESSKGKLFYKNKIKVNGHDGIEFGYKLQSKGQLIFTYNHAVAISDTILTCGIMASDSLSKDDKNLSPFFSGFKVKSDRQLSLDHATELGHKTGKIIAILILISIPVLLGLGIIFIIRRIAYREKK